MILYFSEYKMNRNEVLRALQKQDQFKRYTQSAISKQLGGNIHTLRATLKELNERQSNTMIHKYTLIDAIKEYPTGTKKLKKLNVNSPHYEQNLTKLLLKLQRKYGQFNKFEELPEDLQALILSQSEKTMLAAPRLNTSISRSTPIAYKFYNQFCNLPIDVEEIKTFIEKYLPESFYLCSAYRKIITHLVLDSINKYHAITYNIDNRDESNEDSNESIDQNKQVAVVIKTFRNTITNIFIHEFSIDLKHTYAIHQLRSCETIKPGYSKMKTRESLDTQYNNHFTDQYNDLLFLFMYLRSNLKMFSEPVPANRFKHYEVYPNNETRRYGKDQLNVNELIITLRQHCEKMYQQLITIIDQLH